MEVWKDIEGFNYQVSNLGNVKSKGKYVQYVDSRTGKQCQRWAKPTVLKWSIGTSGYPTTHIYDDRGTRQTVMVHRLVAMYFLAYVKDREFVNHKDGDKTNNHYTNLEWVTRSENILHAMDTGLILKRGEDCNFAVLSEQQALEIIAIRQVLGYSFSNEYIANVYGIHKKYVSDVASLTVNRWKELKESLSQYDLKSIAESAVEGWKPEKKKLRKSKHQFTKEELVEIYKLKTDGHRVCDIAKQFGKPKKVISWVTCKIRDGDLILEEM